jgi:hypothetical protein
MTVSELVKELSRMPQNGEVNVSLEYETGLIEFYSIGSVSCGGGVGDIPTMINISKPEDGSNR